MVDIIGPNFVQHFSSYRNYYHKRSSSSSSSLLQLCGHATELLLDKT